MATFLKFSSALPCTFSNQGQNAIYLTLAWSPSSALLPFFGEGSPAKIDYRREKRTLVLTCLLEDLASAVGQFCLVPDKLPMQEKRAHEEDLDRNSHEDGFDLIEPVFNWISIRPEVFGGVSLPTQAFRLLSLACMCCLRLVVERCPTIFQPHIGPERPQPHLIKNKRTPNSVINAGVVHPSLSTTQSFPPFCPPILFPPATPCFSPFCRGEWRLLFQDGHEEENEGEALFAPEAQDTTDGPGHPAMSRHDTKSTEVGAR